VPDLIGLAQRLVELDRETVSVRSQMLKLLTNGADPSPVHPTQPGSGPAKRSRRTAKAPTAKPSGNHARIIAASAAAEEKIVAALRAQPGMRSREIAQAMGAKGSTTAERLKRLKGKGLVAPVESGGWQATASA
jgi:hypothetical protein